MGLIPNDVINQVIERSDIVEIIGNYTALKKAGRNFKALCPFHNEKTPSFVVNPDKQIFHCFGCGVGGNAVGFLMRQEHLEFPEAVRFLANKAGVTVPDSLDAPNPLRGAREEILKVNALAVLFFHEVLLKSREADACAARDYLKGRGVDLETVKKFQLGFAPNEWDALLKYLRSKGISEELMQKAGLIIAREGKSGHYDRFRNRVVFPIFDIQNRALAFGARAMQENDGAKYINSPETAVYTKGQHMYGLQRTKSMVGKTDQMIVVEGYMDMIMPYIHGVENIAASLGTALTVDQIRLIRRYTRNVLMLFDTDAAGQSAIERSLITLVEEGMNVRMVLLGKDKDPDAFIRSSGVDAFRKCLEQAVSFFDFRLDWYKTQYDINTSAGKSEFFNKMVETIALTPNQNIQHDWARQLKEKFKFSDTFVIEQLNKFTREKLTLSDFSRAPAEAQKISAGSLASEELLLALFLRDPAWAKAAQENISPEDFSDGLMRKVAQEIWVLAAQGNDWSTNDLLIRLNDEPARSLVTGLISTEEGKLGEKSQVFQDCIAEICRKKQKKIRGQLMQAISQAEAQGDGEKLDQLKERFNRSLKTSS